MTILAARSPDRRMRCSQAGHWRLLPTADVRKAEDTTCRNGTIESKVNNFIDGRGTPAAVLEPNDSGA
jgi:hypothetical protein